MTIPRIDLAKYIDIPIWYGCNNNCILCMLSDLKSRLPVIGFDIFKKVIKGIIKEGRYKNLILSGAEATTMVDLETYAGFAASFGWFEKIQIQTNGRRLCDRHYLQRLLESGVNEFFISVHGLEKVHDAITRTSGSYRETMAGIRLLEDLEQSVITNTVLTRMNSHDIPGLMDELGVRGISEFHLWNYCPMEERDSKDLLVSLAEFTRLLPDVLAAVQPPGKALILKHFPQCLSPGPPCFFDSRVPKLLIHEIFWRKFGENRFGFCPYMDQCRVEGCSGLSMAHVHKYGDERDFLRPFK